MAKTLQQLADFIQTEPEIRSLINETVKYLQAAWPPEGSTEVTVYQRTTILTDAQIKALPTTYHNVVPAIADKIILFHFAMLNWKLSAGAYTNIDSDNASNIYYGEGDGVISSLGLVPTDAVDRTDILIFGAEADNRPSWSPMLKSYITSRATSSTVNSGLSLSISNSSAGNLTGGHANNTLEVTVFYSIVDL